ncbi:helix-turn-helix transcriptional regulator [Slackia exigua]|uniref:helix-turn-helix transcriptional regulator n=1 Tax=Slackia exigua TaxID=84109 RepID=UPI0031F3AE2B
MTKGAVLDTPRPDRARFAAKLRRLRDLNGRMTQEELAAASGVDVGLIRNYEQEKSLAKDDALARLADALNASPATFRACALDNATLLGEDAQLRLVGQLLSQISGAYDLEPFMDGDVIGLQGNGGYIELALVEWMGLVEADEADTHEALDRHIEPEDYRAVQDRMVATFAELQRFELGYCGAYDPADYPAQPPTLGETLKDLRKATGLTQGDLAKEAGISMFSVRAYEQGKRVPTDDQRAALAKALNVPDEALTDFGVESPNDAFHYLLELAHIYGMHPQRHDGIVLLAHVDRKKPLNKLIRDWHFEWVEMQEALR